MPGLLGQRPTGKASQIDGRVGGPTLTGLVLGQDRPVGPVLWVITRRHLFDWAAR